MEHEEICQGIQSTVYSMKIFGSEFAVKQLKDCRNFLDFEHPEFTRDQLFVPMQFHPHLVEMYGFGLGSTRKDKSLYIIMGLKEFSLDRFYDFAVENKVSFTASQWSKLQSKFSQHCSISTAMVSYMAVLHQEMSFWRRFQTHDTRLSCQIMV